jgi:tetratricopeptide (TPR) repeat protein
LAEKSGAKWPQQGEKHFACLIDFYEIRQRVTSDYSAARWCIIRLRAALDYADAMFNLALLLQRNNKHAEAVEYWRRYLANDAQSEWAARARRSLQFCKMHMHLSAVSVQP